MAKPFEFTAEMFENYKWFTPSRELSTGLAAICNAKLKEWIEAAPVVVSRNRAIWAETKPLLGWYWQARLVCIEELKEEKV